MTTYNAMTAVCLLLEPFQHSPDPQAWSPYGLTNCTLGNGNRLFSVSIKRTR